MSPPQDRAVAQPPSLVEQLAQWEAERDLQAGRRTAVYVSTPITTGPTFMEWFRTLGHRLDPKSSDYATALRAHVILPNIQHAARFLDLLRWRKVGPIIDPISLEVPGWDQATYHQFWITVVERHVRRVIFLDGWEFSHGCVLEFEAARRLDLDCVDEHLRHLGRTDAIERIRAGVQQVRALGFNPTAIEMVVEQLERQAYRVSAPLAVRELYKDEVLDHLAGTANVAQFVSFGPGANLRQRFCRIRGVTPNHTFASPHEAVRSLLERSPEGQVNVRSFDPRRPEGNPFVRNLDSVDRVISTLRQLGGDNGLFTIVNETVNERDGGVSGVTYRGVVEFAPDATPRCVDDDEIETSSLPFELGMTMLQSVYGFEPDLRGRDGARVEFSIHPMPRGWMHAHTIIWQSEQRPSPELLIKPQWPNAFSRFLGDKAFGLVVTAAAGLAVPRTIVFTRRIFPFTFGQPTGSGLVRTRTCPEIKAPGYYPSARGWTDPYLVLQDWRVLGGKAAAHSDAPPPAPLASVVVQEDVRASYSGRAGARQNASPAVAGRSGSGDEFMVGEAGEEKLPSEVIDAVYETYRHAADVFGATSFEWVFDGHTAWIVQLNLKREWRRESLPDGVEWTEFRFAKGRLEDFRQEVIARRGTRKGILVVGNVSPLSHLGEIAEQYNVPIRFVPTLVQ